MRIRTIKPEFWSHPILAGEKDETRLGAIGLLNVADDEGYFLAEASQVRSALWPLDEDSTRARRVLDHLLRAGYIEVFESTDHGKIGRVVNFVKHQRVDRPTPSRLKAYASTIVRRALDDRSLLDQGSGIRDQGNNKKGAPRVVIGKDDPIDIPSELHAPEFSTAWAKWMTFRRSGKKPANWASMFTEQLDWLKQFGAKEATEILNQSIRQGWTGLFERKHGTNTANHRPHRNDGIIGHEPGRARRILDERNAREAAKAKAAEQRMAT